jgi:hypothetical protein
MVAGNPDVTLDVMKALPDKPWLAAAGALQRNTSFSAADIREFAEWKKKPRCSCGSMCQNCYESRVYITSKPDFSFADLERMAAAEGCSLDPPIFKSNVFLLAYERFGERNPNMTWQLYERFFCDKYRHGYDGGRCYLVNPAVANARAIRENPSFPWNDKRNAEILYLNPAIGAEALSELERLYPGLPFWNWSAYSWSDAVTWNIVVKYWDKPWDMSGLSRNKNVINWGRLSEWPRGLGKEPELEASRLWNWNALSANPAVATWQRVCEHPELPWWSEGLAINRAVCVWEAIAAPPPGQPRAGPPAWNPLQYCFVWSKIQFVGDAERVAWAQRWMATWKIQRRWLPLYYTPGTAVWKRRMLRELGDLQGAGGAAPVAAAAAS